jgi:hypothetical protein
MLAQNLEGIQRASELPIWHYYAQPGLFITIALKYIFPAAGILLLIYLVMGGLQMMLSRGDPKAMQSAQAKITNAVLGFVTVFISYWLVQLIGKIFGITVFGDIFK